MGAWGGSAVAGKLITSKDVKDRSLSGRDLRSNTVTGRNVAGLSGRDIKPDSLDGTDIAEDSLGTVPRARQAARADSAETASSASTAGRAATADALTGARIARVHFARPAGGSADILTLGGLRVRGSCSGSGELTVTATTTSGPGWIRVSGTTQTQNSTAPVLLADDDFRTGDEFSVLGGGADNSAGDLVFVGADGSTLTLTFLAEDGIAASRGYACLFAGTATQTAA